MKSRLVLLACCLALLSSCGQGDKSTGKAPEFAVITVETTTANLTKSYPASPLLDAFVVSFGSLFLPFIVKNTAAAATAITTRAITRIITCFCTCFLRSAFFCSLTASSYRSLLIFSFEPPCDLSKDAELTVLHLHSPVIYQPTFSLNF